MKNSFKNITAILFFFLAFLTSQTLKSYATDKIKVTTEYTKESFPLVHNSKAAPIVIDSADAEIVKIAANALQNDIYLITSVKPEILFSANTVYPVIIGTLGNSGLINQMIKSGVLDGNTLQGKWENFVIALVKNPFKNIEKALVVAGSDRRGTAFGVFELSKMMGVSPWVWWADVTPAHKESIFITPGQLHSETPSVKYRGIFLNDEDWGLQPWGAKHLDTTIKDIGPNTYAHVFELMLRLKANFIWPAMHSCTKAFYFYPDNPKTAEKYAIVVGSSHCEPLLRDNLFEWTVNFEKEYGEKPKDWRYDQNKEQIFRYWDDRAKQSSPFESIYTIGMRGIHDSGMPGATTIEGKVELLSKIIEDQRNILHVRKAKPIADIPQIFCPYKEVLTLYQNGLKIPEDITIVWADDNHGYIRQLSNEKEQQRSGRSGVYYHFSYWGSPYDYLWLSTISPSLTAFEMSKAFNYGADRLWVFNVGDIKPAEMEIEFAMDLAWNVDKWNPENAHLYSREWAARTFGEEFALPISAIKAEYFRLSQSGKPEHLGVLNFSDKEVSQRIQDYNKLVEQAEDLSSKIPVRLQDAYFQLILYPVKGASLINEKIFYARKSIDLAKKADISALEYSQKAIKAFEAIKEITNKYNHTITNGKWNGMMSYSPRNLSVFKMPQVATKDMVLNFSPEKIIPDSNSFVNGKYDIDLIEKRVDASTDSKTVIKASFYSRKQMTEGQYIKVIPQIGLGGDGISLFPYTAPSISDSLIYQASFLEYSVHLDIGKANILVKILPTHAIQKGRGIRYGISVNGDPVQVINLDYPAETPIWKENVIRGYAMGETMHYVTKKDNSIIRIYLPDPGVVVNQIEVK